jgi:hypothetical protein
MGPNVMVDLVEHAVVTVNGGQTPTKVGPLLSAVPGHFLLGVMGAMVVL